MALDRHAQSTTSIKVLQYVMRNIRDKNNILPIDKHQNFLKVDCIIFAWAAKYELSFQSNNSTISFKYLQKEVNDQVNFLLADKYQCFVQVYTKMWVCVARHT